MVLEPMIINLAWGLLGGALIGIGIILLLRYKQSRKRKKGYWIN